MDALLFGLGVGVVISDVLLVIIRILTNLGGAAREVANGRFALRALA
jgi:hypothetical protein